MMNHRAHDYPIRAGQQILRWIRRQGVVFYYGKHERETAKSYLRSMPRVFPELVSKLTAVYLYRQGEQADGRMDGILWKDVTRNGLGTLYAVGLSLEAIARGTEYLQFLFIHELSHIDAPGEHDTRFHANMAGLLAHYNHCTGASLVDEPQAYRKDHTDSP